METLPAKSISELAMMEIKIPGTNMYAPFLVVAGMAGALIGGAMLIYFYNKNRG